MVTRATRVFCGAATLALALVPTAPQAQAPDRDYLSYVRQFGDALLEHGQDRYGPLHLPMWAGLIDTRDYSVPGIADAAATKGGDGYYDRDSRRAVGGANLYHDVETIKVFEALSALTGDPGYAEAARAYTAAFLHHAQNEDTGLLGWGEHLYYDFSRDEVSVGGEHMLAHEFLAKTPIWAKLWTIDAARTRRAIAGLKFHFRSPNTQTYLFNRHAQWDRDTIPSPYGLMSQYQYNFGQPWIKHSALISYSLMFLHARTGDPEWLKWALGVGNLYWNHRNPQTDLTPSAIDDPRPTSARASLTGMSDLVYWLYKASELHPGGAELRERALAMFNAVERHAWRPEQRFYFTGSMNLDGTVFSGDEIPRLSVSFGRTAAYLARHERDPRYLEIAKRMAAVMEHDLLPDAFTAEDVAERIHLLMDIHDLTADSGPLAEAALYADRGIQELWRGGLFARRVGDPYYESKDGIGAFAAGLLRLHLARSTDKPVLSVDWSI